MRVGYRRVSSCDQNLARQLEGIAVDRTFEDKLSGKDRQRPQLEAALQFCRDGDTLMVHSMDRLARNLGDLLAIVKELTDKGIAVGFVKENLTFTGNDTPTATLILSVMGACAQFERAMILERQREGIALAKAAGKYKGRKRSLSPAQARELRELANKGVSKAALAESFGLSRESVYAYLRQADVEELNEKLAPLQKGIGS
jgi:DNA invertase Pin-like site-specific DNA recombinase